MSLSCGGDADGFYQELRWKCSCKRASVLVVILFNRKQEMSVFKVHDESPSLFFSSLCDTELKLVRLTSFQSSAIAKHAEG